MITTTRIKTPVEPPKPTRPAIPRISVDRLSELVDIINKHSVGPTAKSLKQIGNFLAGYCQYDIVQAVIELDDLRESLRWRDRETEPAPPDSMGANSHMYDFCGKWWRSMPNPYPPSEHPTKDKK